MAEGHIKTYTTGLFIPQYIDKFWQMVQPSDHPLLEWIQFFNPRQIGLSDVLTFEDSAYDTRVTALTANFTAATDTTINVTAGTGKWFEKYDIISMGGKAILHEVQAKPAGDTVTITAVANTAYKGTPVDLVIGATVKIRVRTALQGKVWDYSASPTLGTTKYAYFRTIMREFAVSNKLSSIPTMRGITRLAEQIENKTLEALEDCEMSALWDYRKAAESDTVPGASDGIMFQITNVLSGGTFSDTTLADAINYAYSLGYRGKFPAMFVDWKTNARIGSTYGKYANGALPAQMIGGISVPALYTHMGYVPVIPHPGLDITGRCLLLDLSLIEPVPLVGRSLNVYFAGQTGSFQGGAVEGDVTWIVKGASNRQFIVDFTF